MSDIGIRELKIHASEIIHQVKEKRMMYMVTHRGRPVAAIVPVDEDQSSPVNDISAWEELEALGQKISQNWNSEKNSTEILSDQRR